MKLAAILCAALLPMVPAMPKRHHRPAVGIGKGAGAAALLKVKAPALPKAVVVNSSLVWKWNPDTSNPWSNVVFLVRQSDVLKGNPRQWPVVAMAGTNSYQFIVDRTVAARFFSVQASNIITKKTS